MVAEEMREIMASLGFRNVDEMVGRADLLAVDEDVVGSNYKLEHIDLDRILLPAATLRPGAAQHKIQEQEHGLDSGLDLQLLPQLTTALPADASAAPVPVSITTPVHNTHRAVGTTISYEISKRFQSTGLPDDTITLNLAGHAG